MPFSHSDFQNDEVRNKLVCIVNDLMELNVLTRFSDLTTRQKLKLNVKMNEYIKNLPDEGYLEKIHNDFCLAMTDTFEKMKPEEMFIPCVNTDVVLLEVPVE